MTSSVARDPKSALNDAYPGWSVWRSDIGRWWATRLAVATNDQIDTLGYQRTVDATTPADLTHVLDAQNAIAPAAP